MLLVFAGASLFGHGFYIHTLIGGSLLVVVGTQLVGFGLCGRAYAVYQFGDRDPAFERWGRRVRLEHGLLLGLAFMAAGLAVGGVVVAPLDRPRSRQPRRGADHDPGRHA